MPATPRQCIAAAALLAAFAAADSSAQSRRIEELARKSGLWDQVTQMRPQMKGGVIEARNQAKAQGKSLIDDEAHARLASAIDRTFAPEALRETLTLYMEELVAPGDEDEVLKWLSSDLGQRFTRMEVAAAEIAEIRKAEAEAPKILAALPKSRVDKYRRLAASLDAGDTVTTLTISLTTAIVYGLALVTPDIDAEAAAQGMRRRMESQREPMMKFYAERALHTYAYVYRNATEAQVESYVRFAESPAAHRYHAAGIKALDATISQAATALGQDLGGASRRNPS